MKIDNGSNATPQDQKDFEKSAESGKPEPGESHLKADPKNQTDPGGSNWPYRPNS